MIYFGFGKYPAAIKAAITAVKASAFIFLKRKRNTAIKTTRDPTVDLQFFKTIETICFHFDFIPKITIKTEN
jgi:hypothetical protein